MDLYGNPIGNNFSGEVDIDGNLVVSGDGTFENITVTDTATINTLITDQELVVEDPIIKMGLNNPADARYGWKPYTDANLENSVGLPASTFSTEENR